MDLGINIDSLDRAFTETYIVDRIKVRKSSQILKDVVGYLLSIGSCSSVSVKPKVQCRTFKDAVEVLPKNILQDKSGPTNFQLDRITTAASFLAGRKPKIYILPYILFSKGINTELTIWIDDVFSLFKHNRNEIDQKQINSLYKKALEPFNIKCVFTSEKISPLVIPDWLINKFLKASFEDFSSLLPYDRRDIKYIRFLDIIHILWQGVIFSQLNQDYYLSAINTKRQLLFLNRITGFARNFLFLPKLETKEDNSTVYNFGQTKDLFNFLSNEAVEYFYNYYSFAYKTPPELSIKAKRKLLNRYLNEKL